MSAILTDQRPYKLVQLHGQQDAAQLNQLITATGISPHHLLSHSPTMLPEGNPLAGHLDFHHAEFVHGNMSHPQLSHMSSADLSWLQRALAASHHAQGTASGPASSTSSLDMDNQTEADVASINEEKRRRNTAASARFRIKKKQKTVNLQRSISDLTGRADDLEREAADLRRENGWLKEIVMLKNSQYSPMNLVNHMSDSGQRSDAGSSSHQSGSRQTDLEPVSETASSDEKQVKGKKGKTKGRGKDSRPAKDHGQSSRS